jgi:hypothetical protein
MAQASDPQKARSYHGAGRGFDMGAISSLCSKLRVFFTLLFAQIRNHHSDELVLRRSLVRSDRLRVPLKPDATV